MSNVVINQEKAAQLEVIFQKNNNEIMLKEENAKNKTSNLVLMTLQDDKKQMDAWNAFGKVGWSKSF